MKRYLVLLAIAITLTAVNLTSLLSQTYERSKSKEIKGVILTTGEINLPYEIIGIVTGRSGSSEINDATRILTETAKSMQADYVTNVRYVSHAGYLFAYGTACRAK